MLRRVLLLLATGTLVFASDPDFSGNWRLNRARSGRDNLAEPAPVLLNIEHRGNLIRCNAASGNGAPLTWSFTTDRRETRYRLATTSRSTVVKWEADSLLVNTIVNGRDRSYTVMDRWKLSRDGQTLRIDRTVESAGGENEGTLVYERGE